MREKRDCLKQGPKNEDEIASVCPSHTKPDLNGRGVLWHIYHTILALELAAIVVIETIELIRYW